MSPRGLTFALIGSAALNLFLIGALVGVVAMGLRISHARSSARPPLRAATLSLAPNDRAKLLANLRAQAVTVRPLNSEARGLRSAAWMGLSARNFDPTVVKATLAKARGVDQQVRGTVEDSVVDFAATLPPNERNAFGLAMARATADANHPGGAVLRPFWRRAD
jgi:uncharacterized membrane protein